MSFPVITKTKKKEITAYWNNIFPEMGVYKPMWLMNILGPFAVGLCLEIQSNRDTYYPKLHFHNLMEKQGNMSLEMIVEKPEYRITTVSKEEKVIRIMRELKNNIFIPTEGNIRYYDLITKMKDFCQQTYADEQLWTLELLLYLARWTGAQEEEDNCLRFCERYMDRKN